LIKKRLKNRIERCLSFLPLLKPLPLSLPLPFSAVPAQITYKKYYKLYKNYKYFHELLNFHGIEYALYGCCYGTIIKYKA